MTKQNNSYDVIIDFLKKLDWKEDRKIGKYQSFLPPKKFELSDDYKLFVPVDFIDKNDNKFIEIFINIISQIYNIKQVTVEQILSNYNYNYTSEQLKKNIKSYKLLNEQFKLYYGSSYLFNTFVVITAILESEDKKHYSNEVFVFIKFKNELLYNSLRTSFPIDYFNLVSGKKPIHTLFEDGLEQSKSIISQLIYAEFDENNINNTKYTLEIFEAMKLNEVEITKLYLKILENKKIINYLEHSNCFELKNLIHSLKEKDQINRIYLNKNGSPSANNV